MAIPVNQTLLDAIAKLNSAAATILIPSWALLIIDALNLIISYLAAYHEPQM